VLYERVLHLRQEIHSTRSGEIALGLKFLGFSDSGMNLDLLLRVLSGPLNDLHIK